MKTMIFRTNAKCEGCLARIEKTLQGKINREEWNLDLSDPNRTLTVISDKLTDKEIMGLISKAGYLIEPID